MNLGICVVTHNRIEYTKTSIESLLDSIVTPKKIVVVDNASEDGTADYLSALYEDGRVDDIILSPDNLYPGKACNLGWARCIELDDNITHLMRSDNDLLYRAGWDVEAAKAFEAMPLLGQLGTLNQSQCFPNEPNRVAAYTENGVTVNRYWTSIGGPNIISRELWDEGIRYDESPWQAPDPNLPTPQEDVKLSLAIQATGMFFANVIEHNVVEMSFGNTDDYWEYYQRTFTQRGHGIPARTKAGVTLEQSKHVGLAGYGNSGDHI